MQDPEADKQNYGTCCYCSTYAPLRDHLGRDFCMDCLEEFHGWTPPRPEMPLSMDYKLKEKIEHTSLALETKLQYAYQFHSKDVGHGYWDRVFVNLSDALQIINGFIVWQREIPADMSRLEKEKRVHGRS